jgi:hypothetical protein
MQNQPNRPLVPDDCEEMIVVLLDSGVKPPPSLDADGGLERGGRTLCLTLTAAGLTLHSAWEGLLAYIAEPDASQYPKPWPTAGHIAGRTRARRIEAAEPDDAGQQWHALCAVVRSYGDRDDPIPYLRPAPSPEKAAAIRAGIAALGGVRAIGAMTAESKPFRQREFVDAYRGSLGATAAERPMLTGGGTVLRIERGGR